MNFLQKLCLLLNHNRLIFNTTDVFNTFKNKDHMFIKISIMFIRNKENFPLNVVLYAPLTIAEFKRSLSIMFPNKENKENV